MDLAADTFDIVQASFVCPLAIQFPKSRAGAYSYALAHARGAAMYREDTIDGILTHVAAFAASPEDMSRAAATLTNLKGYRGLLIYARGQMVDWYLALRVLRCFRDACACRDPRAHCIVMMRGQQFPCRLLAESGMRLQAGHPSTRKDLIQAAAVRHGCDWCPNFNV